MPKGLGAVTGVGQDEVVEELEGDEDVEEGKPKSEPDYEEDKDDAMDEGTIERRWRRAAVLLTAADAAFGRKTGAEWRRASGGGPHLAEFKTTGVRK